MSGEVSSLVELNDSDILRLEGVARMLNTRQGERANLEAFRKEVIERFGEAGFKVNVKVYDTATPGIYAFDIEITERVSGQFDPDQMVHEVTSDVLGLGTGGVIKTDGGVYIPTKSTHVHKH